VLTQTTPAADMKISILAHFDALRADYGGVVNVSEQRDCTAIIVDHAGYGTVGEIYIHADGSVTELLGVDCSDTLELARSVLRRRVNAGTALEWMAEA
jgi:hypothetical protein